MWSWFPRLVVITPKLCAFWSFVGSALIVRDILFSDNNSNDVGNSSARSRRRGRSKSEKKIEKMSMKIMLGLSIGDMITSFFVHFLGSWLVPKSTGAFWASGNVASCSFQGFVGKFFGQISTYYNVSLTIVFVMMVRYKYTERKFQESCVCRFLLLYTAPIVSFVIAIPQFFDRAYNWTGLHQCYISSVPLGCSGDDCVRGKHARWMDMWLSTNQLIAVNVLLLLLTLLLVYTVFETEKRNDRYLSEGQSPSRKKTTAVASQGLMYVLAFVLTYLPWYVLMFLQSANKTLPLWLILWAVSSTSAQGSFNAIVYFRPAFLNLRRKEQREMATTAMTTESSYGENALVTVAKVLHLPLPPASTSFFGGHYHSSGQMDISEASRVSSSSWLSTRQGSSSSAARQKRLEQLKKYQQQQQQEQARQAQQQAQQQAQTDDDNDDDDDDHHHHDSYDGSVTNDIESGNNNNNNNNNNHHDHQGDVEVYDDELYYTAEDCDDIDDGRGEPDDREVSTMPSQ